MNRFGSFGCTLITNQSVNQSVGTSPYIYRYNSLYFMCVARFVWRESNTRFQPSVEESLIMVLM